tara:strand:+ start:986 stop:2269 length:1284 start_codon:yes stop_codon:yes gene_type:complete
MKKNRREFIKQVTRTLQSLLFFKVLNFKKVHSKAKPKVVVVGGGIGGASCLKYLREFSEYVNLSVIEKKKEIQTCPYSNLVIAGERNLSDITFTPVWFNSSEINYIKSTVNKIDSNRKRIYLENKEKIDYDYLILSPGVSFKNNLINKNAEEYKCFIPHNWDGNKNLIEFKQKLNDLNNNSVIIISAPDYPYRCPPAPYERASLIAYYLLKNKKKNKIFILDSKDSFTKKELFIKEWKINYKNQIEWIGKSDGGKVNEIDLSTQTIKTETGLTFKGDLIHVIPDQYASKIFKKNDLINTDWCQVNPVDFELKGHKNIYVLGDSIDAWDMPKSAFSANSQAKVLVANLISRIFEKEYVDPIFLNTCYSFSAPKRAFSISSWYRLNSKKDRIVSLGSGKSDIEASSKLRMDESVQADAWYESLTSELYS